ncbi:PREDICTED: chymotrypsin-2-like [Ceratosolen solmsi marchali]|uniref:Chymotrypsin-2-like n=1 Tax=Ceratosolen solmsi marchali TaxID=326594 RepID=A0AAJ6VM50_9HYME|nr:PREDICTED: chymotrypsin-2-like [Ceratosolen solmsi marchali]
MHGVNVRFAREGEFPFVVSITNTIQNNQRPEANHVCTGTLVSKRDVVTADHCVSTFTDQTITIIAGSHDIRHGTRYGVLWWLSYNQFSTIQHSIPVYEHNDITMIRLNQTVPDNIVPPPISYVAKHVMLRSTLQTAGFGVTSNLLMAGLMETAKLKIIPKEQCEQRLSDLLNAAVVLDDNKFCAVADPFVLLDNKNSGSPVLYRGQLLGLHIETYPSHLNIYDPRRVNILISVPYYRRFVEAVIKNY